MADQELPTDYDAIVLGTGKICTWLHDEIDHHKCKTIHFLLNVIDLKLRYSLNILSTHVLFWQPGQPSARVAQTSICHIPWVVIIVVMAIFMFMSSYCFVRTSVNHIVPTFSLLLKSGYFSFLFYLRPFFFPVMLLNIMMIPPKRAAEHLHSLGFGMMRCQDCPQVLTWINCNPSIDK